MQERYRRPTRHRVPRPTSNKDISANANIHTPEFWKSKFGETLNGYMNHDPLSPETRGILRRDFAEALVRGFAGKPEEQVKSVEGLLLAVEFKARNNGR